MKKLFIFLNIMLSLCVVLLIYTHISYESTPPDKELELTPQGPNKKQTGIFDLAADPMPGDLSEIYENNIFLVNRGRKEVVPPSSQPKPYKGSFELTGLFKIGDIEGAIINSAGSRKSKGIKSKFYRIKEKIGDTGYTLDSISPKDETAVISNGRSKAVLKLDKNDNGSLKRRQAEVSKQKSIEKSLSISTGTSSKPVAKPVKPAPKKTTPVHRKKTPAEIAAIRKKILERMRAKNSGRK